MIYIVRHGQTQLNRKSVLQGRSDHPLNDVGREQAKSVGDAFRDAGIVFDRVYTSPLGRAVETAELIAGDAPIEVDTVPTRESTCSTSRRKSKSFSRTSRTTPRRTAWSSCPPSSRGQENCWNV